MHPTPLPRCLNRGFLNTFLQLFINVACYKPHPAESPGYHAFQESAPALLTSAVAYRVAENLALAGHGGAQRYRQSPACRTAIGRNPKARCIQPHARPISTAITTIGEVAPATTSLTAPRAPKMVAKCKNKSIWASHCLYRPHNPSSRHSQSSRLPCFPYGHDKSAQMMSVEVLPGGSVMDAYIS